MKNNLDELIKHFDGKICDLCYKIIEESEQLEKDFQYLCENLVELPKEKTIKIDTYFSEEEYELIRKIYDGKIEGILSEVISKVNYGIIEQENFYSELYKNLVENFEEKKKLAIAFERILSDYRIPFVYLGKPLTMSQKDYEDYIEKNDENLRRLIYILKMNYRQKTEEASVFLNFIESIEDYKDRVVVFSRLIDMFKKSGMIGSLKDLISGEREEK